MRSDTFRRGVGVKEGSLKEGTEGFELGVLGPEKEVLGCGEEGAAEGPGGGEGVELGGEEEE